MVLNGYLVLFLVLIILRLKGFPVLLSLNFLNSEFCIKATPAQPRGLAIRVTPYFYKLLISCPPTQLLNIWRGITFAALDASSLFSLISHHTSWKFLHSISICFILVILLIYSSGPPLEGCKGCNCTPSFLKKSYIAPLDFENFP